MACINCQLSKVRCGNSRLCAGCIRMTTWCYDEDDIAVDFSFPDCEPKREQGEKGDKREKRDQVSQACEECKTARLKYDLVKPCKRCARANTACGQAQRRSKTRENQKSSSLEDEQYAVKNLETLLQCEGELFRPSGGSAETETRPLPS